MGKRKLTEEQKDTLEFVAVVVFSLVFGYILYQLSYIPFPEGTLGP